MIRQALFTLLVVALAVCLTPVSGHAQAIGVSDIDTFKVVDDTVAAGTIVPIRLFVVNDSITLMGMAAYFRD